MDSVSLIVLCGFLIILSIREHLLKKKAIAELVHFKNEKVDELVARGKLSEIRTMAAGIAHEISNPLMVITGNIQQLQRNRNPDIKESLEKISNSSARIAKIIQGLRTYTHRSEDLEEVFISLKEMMEEVLLFCEQRLRNHGVALSLLHLDGLYVKGHRSQLEHAFLNLLVYAFDAVDNKDVKWIEVSAEKVRDRILLNFSHSGPITPRDTWSRMTEPFSSHTNGKPGLSVAKTIIESNGGEFHYLDDEIYTTIRLELIRAPLVGIKPKNIFSEHHPGH
jgi:C4-dicarboxylate-specific signal transduction histidine kinase